MNTPTLTGAYTCTHHNDKQRTECPVCLVTALTAERDQLRAEMEAANKHCDILKESNSRACAEVERLNALGSWAHTCIHHNDEQRAKAKGCPVCATAERDQLRAELAKAKERLRSEAMDDYASIKDLQRELAELKRGAK